MIRLFAAALAALVLASPLTATAAPPPAAAFARLPAIETAVISPDGARLAYIGGTADDRVIFIAPLDGGATVTIRPGAVNVKGLRWAGNGYLLVEVLIFKDDTNFSTGMKLGYSFRRELIIEAAGGKVIGQMLQDINFSRLALSLPVLAVVDGDKPFAIVQGLDRAAAAGGLANHIPVKGDGIVPALWKVDLATGKGRIAERGNRLTWSYETDLAGEPRLRMDYDDINRTMTLRGRGKSGGWATIDTSPVDDPTFDALGYSDPDDALILRRTTAAGSRILRHPLTGGAETDLGPVQPSPFAAVLWDDYRRAPVAIVTGAERPVYQWLDPDLAAVHGRLARAMPGKAVSLVSWSTDRQRFVVEIEASDSAPAWFLYDVKTRQASSIGEAYPELAGVPLATSQWISYPAADGLTIPAWLTLPPARPDGARPPLVVLPHGGPAARDAFGFDWLVQFLVSRGYAVLQPQFRGSHGFGDAFERAGYGEWGGKMQTDLVDGVKAAAAHGVDSSRACIVGLSYGGYAALAGATFRPRTFQCAVSVNGDADLQLTVGSTRRTFGEDSGAFIYWRVSIGDPRIDTDALAAASPARRIGAGASPILLLHSEFDTVVPIEQGRTMERALKAAGQSGDLVVLAGEDHYLSKSSSRLRFLSETEAFLARHLPVAP